MRGNSGRPRKPNESLDLTGSRNKKFGQIESGDLLNPESPPHYLSTDAKAHWNAIVPGLVQQGTAKEADRTLLAMLCSQLARFHDTSFKSDGSPTIEEIERRNICKNIVELSDRFGMSPLSRSRSGISKKVSGVKQRPN